MNDRYKFRVWDNEISAYRQSGTVQLCSTGEPFIINGDMHPEAIDNVTIEQSTGLRDRNGKLIYEGDIIDKNGSRCEVDWFRGEWNIGGEPLNYLCMNFEVEVVGNIHEVKHE